LGAPNCRFQIKKLIASSRIWLTGSVAHFGHHLADGRPRWVHVPEIYMSTTPQTNPKLANSVSGEPVQLTIPVVHEQVEISTVREHAGTVRIRKVVRDVDESVPTTGYRERVEIQRKPANRRVESAEPARQEADVLIVSVYEERVVKQLFLTEEIHVTRHREAVQGNELVKLKREEVLVERFDPVTEQWVTDPG
jgi:stress response protein YsnF